MSNKKLSFKDFAKNQKPVTEDVHVAPPTDAISVEPEALPVLFASIHHQSDDRPDGYTPADLFWLNHDGNSHMPDLQKTMRDTRRAEGHDDVKDEAHYEASGGKHHT